MTAAAVSPAVAGSVLRRAAPSPQALLDAALERLREACAASRFDAVPAAARAMLGLVRPGNAGSALLALLTAAQPSAAEAPTPQTLWLLQRADGRPLGLLRLRDGGETSGAVPDAAAWTAHDGAIVLRDRAGAPSAVFTLAGTSGGRRVRLGLHRDSQTVLALVETDCLYSKLRALEPELVAPFGALLGAGQLQPALPPRPAVLLAAPRTGSHLLLNLLNSSNRVFFDAELLNASAISVFGEDIDHDHGGALFELRANDPVAFLKTMITRSHHVDGRWLGDVPVRGFKLFPQQSHAALAWVLAEPAMRIVHLRRENLLAEYSSVLVAYERGHWVGGPASLKQHRVRFSAERFVRFVETKRQYLDELAAKLQPRAADVFEIDYAGIGRGSVNALLAFLTGDAVDADLDALGLPQQLAERVIDRFDNPDEVRRCLDALGRPDWAEAERAAVTRL